MAKIVCGKCQKVHDHCAECPEHGEYQYDFANSDVFLDKESKRVLRERKALGLDGLVGGLKAVIINVEDGNVRPAAEEFLRYTGYGFAGAYEDDRFVTCRLTLTGSADIIVRSRKGENPFRQYNLNPKSRDLPNTRLETFVFACGDVEQYQRIQRGRGVEFLDEGLGDSRFAQTVPSRYTGLSVGLLEGAFTGRRLDWELKKPGKDYLANIGFLDHTASRVKARDRDAAIIEFLELTNYHFDFAIYVKTFNSITNVARLSGKDFAMVFTSGIVPFRGVEESGPTEKFIYNYGVRTHHLAFVTQDIENVYARLTQDGMEYLVELVGSEADGLKQTFTRQSDHTMLVNEYIHRYGDFDGFFTRSNVTRLTGATDKQ